MAVGGGFQDSVMFACALAMMIFSGFVLLRSSKAQESVGARRRHGAIKQDQATETEETAPAPPLIFVSAYGDKFHTNRRCAGLRSADKAKVRELTPCRVCVASRGKNE